MRVALVAYWFGEFCVPQANALSEHIEVTLLYPEGQLGRSEEILSDRVTLTPIPKHPRRSLKNLLSVRELIRLIRGGNPDIIHFHVNGHARLMLAIPGLRDIPLVATVHDPVPHPGECTWVKRWANRAMRRHSDHFLLHGEALCRAFHDRWGTPWERMTSIPLGALDFSPWHDADVRPPSTGHVLLFGRIRPYKGIEVLIEAARRLRTPAEEMKIVIAGRGDDLTPHLNRIDEWGLTERFVIMNEFIEEPMVEALFREARAVVLPYTEASQSGPASMAFALGRPVVASRVGALAEVVRDGETGLTVPPGDPEALAEALDRIAQDEALAARLAEGSRRLGETELSWDTTARSTIEVYEHLLQSGKSRS